MKDRKKKLEIVRSRGNDFNHHSDRKKKDETLLLENHKRCKKVKGRNKGCPYYG